MTDTPPTWGRLDKADRQGKPDPLEPPMAAPPVVPEATSAPPPVRPAASRESVKLVVETLGSGAVKETWVGMRNGPPPLPREPEFVTRRVSPWALRRGGGLVSYD